MASNYQEFFIELVDTRTKKAVAVAATAVVMQAGLSDLQTLYADSVGTSLSQPVAMSASGALRFFVDSSTTSVDITVLTANGDALYVKGVTKSIHRFDVDPDRRFQLLVLPLLFSAGGTETDTGFDFPANMLLKDVYLRVLTVDATETVDIGILSSEVGGDADGFIAAASVATAGYVDPTPAVTAKSSNTDFIGATKYGVLLVNALTGGDVAGTPGAFVRQAYRTDGTAASISYTPSTSDTFKGLAYFDFLKLA